MARRGGRITPQFVIHDYHDSDEAPVIGLVRELDDILYTFAHVGDLHRARASGQKWLRLGVHAGNREARKFYARAGLQEAFLTLEKPLI